MHWTFGRESDEIAGDDPGSATARLLAEAQDPEEVRLEMVCAMVGALGARDRDFTLSEHCGRVAAKAAEIADACGVAEPNVEVLASAATLHEVGRIALPTLLPDGSTPELTDSFGKLRAHARIGGEIVRATRGPLAGWLVEQQYSDYEWLRRVLREGNPELLLAGILRVADVADAVEHRRNPQAGACAGELLRRGRGIRFHPHAVDAYLELAARHAHR